MFERLQWNEKMVFEHLYSLQVEEDVDEVVFASSGERYLGIDHLDKAAMKLKAMLKFPVDVESCSGCISVDLCHEAPSICNWHSEISCC